MADFDLTQTDAQVQSILNDGQNMQGAGAQTTLTTESVLLKDVNGNYHKILKSSFTEAIRDTLAGLLVNNDKGTTINQIAAIANNDFGSITPANLASVLGVQSLTLFGGTTFSGYINFSISKGYSVTFLATWVKYGESTDEGVAKTQVFLITATWGGVSVQKIYGTMSNIEFWQKQTGSALIRSGAIKALFKSDGNFACKVITIGTGVNDLAMTKSTNVNVTDYTKITVQD